MNLRPYTVARHGVYAALTVAVLSVWLGQRAGVSLDYTLLRAVFVFVIFTGLAFGADVILMLDVRITATGSPAMQEETQDE